MIPAKGNARRYLGVILVIALFVGLMVAGLAGSIRSGNYIVIPLITTSLCLFVGAIWFSRYRVRVLLRDRTPERIIAHYKRSVRRLPNAQAAAGYLSSLAATFFGDYERARAELDEVDWTKVTAVYQGHRSYALAFLALLEQTNYPDALRLADAGAELQKDDPAGGLLLLDDTLRLVAEGPADERIARLEITARKQQGLMPGICAWALAIHYKRSGDETRAAEFKAILKDTVPHCAALRPAQT